MAAAELQRHENYMNMPCTQGELEYVMHLGKSVISNMTDSEFIRFDARRRKLREWAKANGKHTW